MDAPPLPRRSADHRATGWWLLDSLVAALFAGALALALDRLLAADARGATGAALGMALAAVLRAWIQARAESAGIAAGNRAKRALRATLFPLLLRARGRSTRLLGEDLATAVDQVEALTGYDGRFMPLRRAASIAPLLIAALVAFASPIAAGILVLTLLPFIVGMAFAGGAARRAADAQVEALSRLSGLFVDRIRALPILLAFGAEARVTRQVETAVAGVADRTYAVLRIAFLSTATLEFFSAISVALVAVYCGFNLLRLLPFPVPKQLTLGRAFFALALAPEFYLPLRRLAAAYHEKQLGESALAAISARTADADTPPAPVAADTPAAALMLDGAAVAYADGRRIGPFSLAVARGEMVALTGPTGSGKSSLLHLVVGLAPIAAGCIRLDGTVVEPGAANARIGWAGQHVMLLPGTLADNLALARPDAGRDAIRAAAERAGLGPLIAARPEGLDTPIDPRGAGLSGGERRRIGIARALLADRPLLLFDEPTADLDAQTAGAIIALLADLARDHAVLAATHDPALIAAASREVAIA